MLSSFLHGCTTVTTLFRWTSFCLLLAGCIGCTDREAQRRAAQEQAQARAESAAAEGARQVDEVLAAGKVEIAHAYAVDVVSRFPQTRAAQALNARLPELKAAADKEAEGRRLAALWTYHAVDDAEAGGTVYTAYIHGSIEGSSVNAPSLRLVLRRHPSWGQSVYLLMEQGDFACQEECRVPVSADGGEAQMVLVSRAKDNVPPALFLDEDEKALALVRSARRLHIDLPLLGGQTRRWLIEVAALDVDRLGPPVKPGG